MLKMTFFLLLFPNIFISNTSIISGFLFIIIQNLYMSKCSYKKRAYSCRTLIFIVENMLHALNNNIKH